MALGGSSLSRSRATSISTARPGMWERNALRAGLVHRDRKTGRGGPCTGVCARPGGPPLCDWPLPEPSDWAAYVSLPQTEAELEAVRRCVRRGCPVRRAASGLSRSPTSSGCNRRSAAEVALIQTVRKPATTCMLPSICPCSLSSSPASSAGTTGSPGGSGQLGISCPGTPATAVNRVGAQPRYE